MLLGSGTDPRRVDEQRLEGQVQAMYGGNAVQILEGYRELHPSYSPGDLLVRIWSDEWRMEGIRLAEAHGRSGDAGTYMYLFSWGSPVVPFLGSAHGIDGTFYFDNTQSVGIVEGNPEAQALARKASTAWANLARHGGPSAEGLPEWSEYSLDTRETMVLSASPQMLSDPLGDERRIWERIAKA